MSMTSDGDFCLCKPEAAVGGHHLWQGFFLTLWLDTR
jgi:hypothetical protein